MATFLFVRPMDVILARYYIATTLCIKVIIFNTWKLGVNREPVSYCPVNISCLKRPKGPFTLKRKWCHVDEIFVTGCTVSCQTKSSGASNESFAKIVTFSFQCYKAPISYVLSSELPISTPFCATVYLYAITLFTRNALIKLLDIDKVCCSKGVDNGVHLTPAFGWSDQIWRPTEPLYWILSVVFEFNYINHPPTEIPGRVISNAALYNMMLWHVSFVFALWYIKYV